MAVTNTSYLPSISFDPGLPTFLPLGKSSAEHAFLNKFKNPPTFGAHRDQIPLIKRIQDFCLILLKLAVFFVSPNLFVFGLFCGIVWDETCHAAIEKIKAVFYDQTALGKAICTAGAIIAGPAVLLTTCFLTAASLGGQCHRALKFD